VFETVSDSVICSECKMEMSKGNLLFMEKGQPLCLSCADLDHLEFLPAGDAALSRRARKYSPLSTVVVRFTRARRHYERQGILATPEAIARAEQECIADAPERARLRAYSAGRRWAEDAEFVRELTQAVLRLFPGCPPEEAASIAEHTGLRGSGRVGRSAAGRSLDDGAVTLAVRAHVRHAHTSYDELLMAGVERHGARRQVASSVARVVEGWSAAR
jgi:hypothetical protein